MVDGNVEESLDLPGVKIHCQYAIRPGRHQQVGHQAAGDRFARGIFLVFTRVPVIWRDGSNPPGRRPPQRVHHDQQLHEVLVHRVAGRLEDKRVHPARVLFEPHVDLAVSESGNVDPALRNVQVGRDLLTERRVRGATEQFQFAVGAALHYSVSTLPRIVVHPGTPTARAAGAAVTAGIQPWSCGKRTLWKTLRGNSQRGWTRNLMAVRSSPSIMTLVNAGMVIISIPLGATNPRVMAIALTAWFTAPAPTACSSTDPFSRSTAATAPATALGFESAPTLSTSGIGAASLTALTTTRSIGLPLFRMPTMNSSCVLFGWLRAEFCYPPRPPALEASKPAARSAARNAASRSDTACVARRARTACRSSQAARTSRRPPSAVSAGSGRNRPTPTRVSNPSTLGS